MGANRVVALVLVSAVLGCDSTDGPSAPGPGPSELTAESIAAGGDCAAPTGAGTTHSTTITSDERWTAATSPHRIGSTGLIIRAQVTVEACAVVLLEENATITVDGNERTAVLRAEGGNFAQLRPVVFKNATAGEHWGMLYAYNDGQIDLRVTALVNGGSDASAQNGGGAIVAIGENDGTVTEQVLTVDVFILDAERYGVNLQVGAGFGADSDNLVIHGAGNASAPEPLYVMTPGAYTIPEGDYTGNELDQIRIDPTLNIINQEVLPARGVPYVVDGTLYVRPEDNGATAILSVDAGVTVRFESGGITLGDGGGANDYYGLLIANGTQASPIVFSSAQPTPAAGDWRGLYFDIIANDGNELTYAVVEYAGGESTTSSHGCGANDNDAAVILLNGRPDDAFIQNTVFRHNAGESTIVSGWNSDLDGPDLVSTNTFDDTPGAGLDGCAQTLWRDAEGNCPDTVEPDCAN